MFRNSELLNFGIKKYEQLAEELYYIHNQSKELDEDKKFVYQYKQIQLILKKWKCENINNSAELKFFLGKIEKKDSSIGNLLELLQTSNANYEEIVSWSDKVRLFLKRLKKEPEFYEKIKKDEITKFQKKLKTTPSITLITKIMLGVYTNTPAIDIRFQETAKIYCQINFSEKDEAKKILEKIKKILAKEIDEDKNSIQCYLDKMVTYKGLTKEKKLDAIFFERAGLDKNL